MALELKALDALALLVRLFGEIQQSWVASDLELGAKGLASLGRTVNGSYIYLVHVHSVKFAPSWGQTLTVTTPWRVKLDKPRLIPDKLAQISTEVHYEGFERFYVKH